MFTSHLVLVTGQCILEHAIIGKMSDFCQVFSVLAEKKFRIENADIVSERPL